MTAAHVCLTSAGAFFLTGLVTGAWKYGHMLTNREARAPQYVDTAHRASLLYAFACVLLAELTRRSAWSDRLNLAASAVLVLFFALSVLSYITHGLLRDTNNQFQRPHRLGRRQVSPTLMLSFMALLVAAEIGGFLVIFTGFLATLR